MCSPFAKNGMIRTNNTTLSTDEKGNTVCRLHGTEIATFMPKLDQVALHTGGYNTPTTLRRMNECLKTWGFLSNGTRRVAKADFAERDTRLYTRLGLVP